MTHTPNYMKVPEIRAMAKRAARAAGLDADTADAVARRVLEKMRPHQSIEELIRHEIAKHAAP